MATVAKARTNGAAQGGKRGKPVVPTRSPSASGTATPSVLEDATGNTDQVGPAKKPDQAAHKKEQEELKTKIDALQKQMSAVQDKINSGSGSGPAAGKRAELRAQWDQVREEQSKFKNSRGQIMAQLKTVNENVARKVKDLQALKAKIQFKSVNEIDAHIKQLEKQVESGSMKVADEKRALQEISQCKRQRRTLESFQADEDAIDRDRATADELRKQLDDPEAKAVHDRADTIKAQLDQLRKESDEVNASRDILYKQRNELKAEIDKLYEQKRTASIVYKEANDRYWAKVHEDRARRAERARLERIAEEERKKKEVALRLREEAEAPAYQAEIEDCQTLIDYFSGKNTGAIRLKSASSANGSEPRAELANVPKLELRQVESDTQGLVAIKKKSEEEENYFVAGGGKNKKGKKGGAKHGAANGDAQTPSSSAALNVPLPTLAALLSLSIPPPSSQGDLPQTIENLKIKKAWFEANSERQTKENVAKAEANIKRLLNGGKADAASPDSPPNGDGEKPPEPAPTPSVDATLGSEISVDKVDEQLEDVAEEEA